MVTKWSWASLGSLFFQLWFSQEKKNLSLLCVLVEVPTATSLAPSGAHAWNVLCGQKCVMLSLARLECHVQPRSRGVWSVPGIPLGQRTRQECVPEGRFWCCCRKREKWCRIESLPVCWSSPPPPCPSQVESWPLTQPSQLWLTSFQHCFIYKPAFSTELGIPTCVCCPRTQYEDCFRWSTRWGGRWDSGRVWKPSSSFTGPLWNLLCAWSVVLQRDG